MIYSLDYSPDGKVLAIGSRDEAAWMWNTDTGELRQTLARAHMGCAFGRVQQRWTNPRKRELGWQYLHVELTDR